MNRDKLRLLTIFGLTFYLLSLMAPAMISLVGLEISEPLEEVLSPEEKPDGWEQLNDAQRKSMVDWSRNSDSQNSLFKGAGGSGFDIGTGIVVDSSGNVYVTGVIMETATFGSISLTSSGLFDIFIAKMSSSGSWEWVVKAGGSSTDIGAAIDLDSSGNVYVIGVFEETATFGGTSLTSSGDTDIFIAKLSSSGSWQWAVKAGGTNGDEGYGIAVDSSGNAYVTGFFSENATFGSTNLASNGQYDIFIAKLNSSGSWQWTVQIGNTSEDQGRRIAVDSSGNAYVTGIFMGTATFGSTILSSSGGRDIFIAKLSSSGSWLWAVKAGGSSTDYGLGIAVDSSGNAYATGYFFGTATFGSTSLTSDGTGSAYSIFIAKLSSSGSWQWAVKAGDSSNSAMGRGIAVDSSGNVYATGAFQGTAAFGNIRLVSSGSEDIFIAKLSSSGSWQWAVKAGGPNEDEGFDIAVDSSGNVYATGYFQGTATFGGTSLTSMGSREIFIANPPKEIGNYSNEFEYELLIGVGGSGYDWGTSIAVDAVGSAYVTGYFEETVAFGSTSLTSSGDYDIFIAKLSSSGSWQWAVKAGGEDDDQALGVALDSSGYAYATGYFRGTAAFGSTNLTSSSGTADTFVAKLSSSGSWEWVVKVDCSYIDKGIGIALDSSGNAYVTGEFRVTATFGSTSLSSSSNSQDIFIAKLSSSGSWQWAVGTGGSYTDHGSGIALDSSGNVYTTGEFQGTATFGSTSLSSSSNSQDIFIAKLSSSGSWQWAVKAGGSSYDGVSDIAVDSSGNSFVIGYFKGTATFGSTSLVSYGGDDIIVAKLSNTGSWEWAVKAGGISDETGRGIAVDSSGNAYVTGYFQMTMTAGNLNITSSGQSIGFLAKLDSSNGTWMKIMEMELLLNDISVENGFMYGVSHFSGTISDNGNSLTSNGNYDILVAKSGPDTDADGSGDWYDVFPFESTQQTDQDGDGFGDELSGYHGDSCPGIFGTSWQDRWGCADMDGDGQSDLYDAYMQNPTQWNDSDGDGLGDNWDGSIVDRNGSSNGIGEYWPNAYLPDLSPLDYDNDGFEDSNLQGLGASGPFDDCPMVYGTSTVSLSGCPDSDSDGWPDTLDSHPGDGSQHNDSDGDGYGDNPNGNLPDTCPSQNGTSTKGGTYGCPDSDGDGWPDTLDSHPSDSTQWSDVDGDGYGDNTNGNNSDAFPSDPLEWADADGDGRGDNGDAFSNNSFEWSDVDGDGYGDNSDECPFVYGNISAGAELGCPDSDGDGYADGGSDDLPDDASQWQDKDGDGFGEDGNGSNTDDCPTRFGTSTIDRFGCEDDDGDGVSNLNDACEKIYGQSTGDTLGCPDADTDGDGVLDIWDQLPFDATQSVDSDNDGYGEDMDGKEPDACPTSAGSSWLGGYGCPDADKDGWGNINDAFPTDGTQWNDTDSDGYGDSEDGRTPDACPEAAGNSTKGDMIGCPDADADGWADSIDAFSDDATMWSDADGDGYADQGDDDCPNLFGLSNISMVGCPDLDSDGLPDILDPDIDGDGLFNTWEYQTDNDPFDAADYPEDTDGDGTPDQFDDDDDGDEFPDSVEKERGTDPKDPEDNPMNQYGDNSGIFFVPGEGFQSGYDAEGYELSVSALVNMVTSEFILPLLLLPASLLLLLRKRGRFKKMRKHLESVGSVDELDGAEGAIDRLIMKNRVKVVHGILLRNLYERRRDQLGEGGPKPTLQSRNEEMQSEQSTEWGASPQRPDDFGDDSHIGGGGRY